ncbi:Sec-independent protein translocase protein TatB [Pseudomonas syringae]|nr:Sec-independent protein translocase protein TatB [Pseudomonas syringae]MCQ3030549.1 Sec-independent protein translocase protein TatB [Pseudomonas syringae]MDG6402714.1 Sec-independent protein translocase protein TatB [Pseudomonas quasicaspiana]
MFEIGFTELLLVGTVALLVLGPERLPKAASTAGRWLGKFKRGLNGIKLQMERELDAEQLRKELDHQPLRKLEQELREGVRMDMPGPSATASGQQPL